MLFYGDLNSGNCLKVKYAADFLGLPYTFVPVDIMSGGSQTAAFRALNDMAQVPVIVLDDGRALAQSNAILRYLARGSSLLPEDPYLQAKVDELLFWEQYSHEPYVAVCRFQMVYLKKPKEARDSWRVQKGEAALDLMEARLARSTQAGGGYLVGDALSIADIALLAYTRLAHEGGFDLSERPNLTAWISRCEQALALQRN